jgi:hypothetical protein
MATVTAYGGYSLNEFGWDISYQVSHSISESIVNNYRINGVTYRDAYIVEDYTNGAYFDNVYAGNFSTNASGVVTGGTVSAYYTLELNGNAWDEADSITGFSENAVDFQNAATSGSQLDTALILANILLGNDVINGSTGNDVLFGGAGNDLISGGGGTDTAIYLGKLSDYTVTRNYNGSVTVADNYHGINRFHDGVDTLYNIAQASFSDYKLVFDLHSSEDSLVYRLYQAAYDRTPDNSGFRYWASIADSYHLNALTLADAFLQAPEFADRYGQNPTNYNYVYELYSNVLGRAPDQAGFNFWLSEANAGLPRDQLLVAFATSPENVTLTAPHMSNGYWTT